MTASIGPLGCPGWMSKVKLRKGELGSPKSTDCVFLEDGLDLPRIRVESTSGRVLPLRTPALYRDEKAEKRGGY